MQIDRSSIDDKTIGASAQKSNVNAQEVTVSKVPRRTYHPGYAGRIATALLVTLGAMGILYNANKAEATPTMTVELDPGYQNGDFQYLVTNTSGGFDTDDSMQSFTLPAGSLEGVYDATAPDNWSFIINANDTYFSTETALIDPHTQGVFELYSSLLTTGQKNATAQSHLNGDFNHSTNGVSTTVPVVPEPATMALVLMGLLSLYRRK
jgi:hypothetical protein